MLKRIVHTIPVILLLTLHTSVFAQKKKDGDIALQRIKTEMDVNKNYPKALTLAKQAVQDFPGNADFRFLLGRLYYLNSNYNEAEKVLNEVIDKTPEYKDVYVTAANVQMAKKNTYRAITILNQGQGRFGRDFPIRSKKLGIYGTTGNYYEGNMYADSLLRQFYRDTAIKRIIVDYYIAAGDDYTKRGLLNLADKQYSKAVEVSPDNKMALQSVYDARMKSGNPDDALNLINGVLTRQPDNYEMLMKKAGILEDLKRYPEAIETVSILLKKYPGDSKVRQMDLDLKLEAARYFKASDPYFQYQSVLERAPGNQEALNNVINIAISRNMYDDALYWINKSLGKNGTNRDLLTKKMSILNKQEKYIAAAGIAEILYRNNTGNADARQTFIDLQLAAARDYNAQELSDSALNAYRKVLKVEPRNEIALNSTINILSGQKNYRAALNAVDEALRYYPNDMSLTLKKASILQVNEQYDEAAALYEQMLSANPGDPKIAGSMVEAYMVAAKHMMEVTDYDAAATFYQKVLTVQPDNKEAIANITNIELTMGGEGNERALQRLDNALIVYPEDKDLLVKKAEALNRLNRGEEAAGIIDSLHNRYPYNTQIRDLYVDQYFKQATAYRQKGDSLNAINAYYKVLSVRRRDTTAWMGLENMSYEQGRFEATIAYADTALSYYPQHPVFMLKKASAMEQLKRFPEAALVMDTLVKKQPENKAYLDYDAYLKSKTFKHQIGFAYLNSHIDSAQAANIASLQYSYLGKKASLTGRLNFAGRSFGTGLQFELESYINHSSTWYSYVNAGIANKLVFPKYKAAYSLFHNFKHGWEVELGGRFLNFDSISTVSGVLAIAHYFGDFWVNAKGYGIFISGKQYVAINVTARQYLNNKTDFFYANIGYGNSPDEFNRVYQLANNIAFTTYSIGAGYQKMFNYRNVVSLNGTWYNQKRDEGIYRNQYDIYLTFMRKF